MTKGAEHKFSTIDLKQVSDTGEFEGYASKFGDRDKIGDAVMKGAFAGAIRNRGAGGIKMLWQHEASHPIGVWDEIKEDGEGLFVRGRILTAVSKGQEVYELMRAGVVDGLSIGFRTIKSAIDERTGFRNLKELDLWEISVVTFPMLETATVTSVKGDWDKRKAERVLRDAGMPNAMATKLVAGGWDAADTKGQGDPDDGLSDAAERLRRMNETLQGRL